MGDFYRVTYWRTVDGAARVTTDAENATVAVVELASELYGYQSTPYAREFPWPSGKSDLSRHVSELRRAFEIGRQSKAAEVARTIRQLCGEG